MSFFLYTIHLTPPTTSLLMGISVYPVLTNTYNKVMNSLKYIIGHLRKNFLKMCC